MTPQQVALAGHPKRFPAWAGYGVSLLMVGVATVIAVVVDRLVTAPNVSLIFVLPVVIAAASFGWGPAIANAAAGTLAYNFFLIPPRYTLRVSDPANVWALVLLLIVASVVSAVAAQSRRRAFEAVEAAERAEALQGLARDLVGAADRFQILRSGAEALHRLFKAPAVVIEPKGGEVDQVIAAGGGAASAADCEAAKWAIASRLPSRGGAYPIEKAQFDFWPILTQQRAQFALGLAISEREEGRPEAPERLVDTVAGYLSVALDREVFARQALESQVRKASEALKANLLAAVSHDLKTPLSTILIALQSLRKFASDPDDESQIELLSLAETETARLSGLVSNLLDMNRIEAGAVTVRAEPEAAAAIAGEAVRRVGAALAGRPVAIELDAASPILFVDASLFESALANVLENAAKYSPAGSEVRIRAGVDGDEGWVEVLDEGPGFTGPVEPLFDMFTRGVEGDGRPPGTGLGLAIAKGFVEAQGGRIEARSRPDRPGASVRLYAPLAHAPRPS